MQIFLIHLERGRIREYVVPFNRDENVNWSILELCIALNVEQNIQNM